MEISPLPTNDFKPPKFSYCPKKSWQACDKQKCVRDVLHQIIFAGHCSLLSFSFIKTIISISKPFANVEGLNAPYIFFKCCQASQIFNVFSSFVYTSGNTSYTQKDLNANRKRFSIFRSSSFT